MNRINQILMVEDNPDDEALLLNQLKKADLHEHLKVIRDGEKAFDYLVGNGGKTEPVAAVFLALNLPTLNGVKILEAIRKNDRLQDLPVIIMTSSNAPEDLERCHVLGVSGYVNKPLTLPSFAKAFADALHARRVTSAETACSLSR
jgi:CheY-like chemotaxis protein